MWSRSTSCSLGCLGSLSRWSVLFVSNGPFSIGYQIDLESYSFTWLFRLSIWLKRQLRGRSDEAGRNVLSSLSGVFFFQLSAAVCYILNLLQNVLLKVWRLKLVVGLKGLQVEQVLLPSLNTWVKLYWLLLALVLFINFRQISSGVNDRSLWSKSKLAAQLHSSSLYSPLAI